MRSIVALVGAQGTVEEIRNSVFEALRLIDFKANGFVESVVIKPNLCYYWDADTGQTTDPRVVAGLIDYVREAYGEDVDIKIVEADASAMRTKLAFKVLGYEKLAIEKDVELFNLSEDVLVDKTVKANEREFSFKVPQVLLDSDLFINVPKLKVMKTVKITCAMKNIFGCIGTSRKVVYHKFLEEAIVGINKVLKPHLTVVDGLVALGKHPIRLNLIMAGVDPFSIDWVASKIMGYNPRKVKFLKIAKKEKLGSPDGIVTTGESIEDIAKVFPKNGIISTSLLWNIQFKALKVYKRIVGDVIPPLLEE
jgi:uncharacterized protein (DUF362 family)